MLSLTATILIVLFAGGLMIYVGRIHRLASLNPLTVAFISVFATHYVQSVYYCFDPSKAQAEAFNWAAALSLLCLAIGGGLANLIAGFSPISIERYYRVLEGRQVSGSDRMLVHALGLVCLVIFVGYVYEVPIWPLKMMWEQGSSVVLTTAEQRALTTGAGMASEFWYVYSVTRLFLMPLLTCGILLIWSKLGLGGRIWAGALILMILVYNSWTGQKVPVVMLFFISALMSILRFGGRIRMKGLLTRLRGVTVSLVLIGALLIYPVFVFRLQVFGETHSLWEILVLGVFRRILVTPALLSYQQFELFSAMDFTYFQDIRKLSSLLDLEYINLSHLTSTLGDFDFVYNAPPAALGNFYAQGGWPVLLMGMLFAGFLLQVLFVWTLRRCPKSRLTFALLALLSFGGFRLGMTNFHTILLTESLTPSVLMVLLWRTYLTLFPLPRWESTGASGQSFSRQ